MTYPNTKLTIDPNWPAANENMVSLVSLSNSQAITALKANPDLVESNKNSAYYKVGLFGKTFWMPLCFCAKSVEMFEFLKSNDYPIYKLSSWHQNFLSHAIKQGNALMVEHLIVSQTFDPFYKNSNTLRYSLYHPEVTSTLLKLNVFANAPDSIISSILLNSFSDLAHAKESAEDIKNIASNLEMLYNAMPQRISSIIEKQMIEGGKTKYDLLSNSILVNAKNLVAIILNCYAKPSEKILNYGVQKDRTGRIIYCTLGLAATKLAHTGDIQTLIYIANKLKEENILPKYLRTVTVRNQPTLLYNVLFDNPVYASPFNKEAQTKFVKLWPWPEEILSYIEEKERASRWRYSSVLKEEIKIICEHKMLSDNFNALPQKVNGPKEINKIKI